MLRSPNYIPTLDGWRAVAILAVIVSHSRDSLFAPGAEWESPNLWAITGWGRLGVDLFFAISGFLITGRLLEESARYGRFSLSAFYTRRVFRIFPPYLLYLVVIGFAGCLGVLQVFPAEIEACLLFYRNYAMDKPGVYTNHFWSLAVEEHFYLLWPLMLLLAGPRRVVWLIPVLGLALHVWRAFDTRLHLFARLLPDSGVLWRTDTRIDALLWGCFAALQMRILQRWKTCGVSCAWALVGVAILAVVAFDIPMRPLWLALLFPVLIVSTVLFPASIAGRVLEWGLLRWIGHMSYSLYLWQTLFLQTPGDDDPFFGMRWLKDWPINLVAIFLTASASYYLVERPVIRIGHRLTSKSRRSMETGNEAVINDLSPGKREGCLNVTGDDEPKA